MINLSREIRRTDVENRRAFLWANALALGAVGLMAGLLLFSNGGAPNHDNDQARAIVHPPLNSMARPNG